MKYFSSFWNYSIRKWSPCRWRKLEHYQTHRDREYHFKIFKTRKCSWFQLLNWLRELVTYANCFKMVHPAVMGDVVSKHHYHSGTHCKSNSFVNLKLPVPYINVRRMNNIVISQATYRCLAHMFMLYLSRACLTPRAMNFSLHSYTRRFSFVAIYRADHVSYNLTICESVKVVRWSQE